ncbi:50S ribosomal protein L11 methyltransferase [Hyphomicrobium sp. CS1BSMeth3]|uniref:class I SAM-dependent methyltransferase n=1 Tax=Hyphomicrobium sp. CS1BSMeth3 TaxID=1892844 RepID=UPI000931709F|nr:50S ribosomal protein L11 methyltransferase [Hyphomicrobium sp. CS1BSMeth3]
MIDRTGFILANTRLLAPPLVPEIRLHLAEESLPIWRKTEEELGEMGLPPPYWAFAWAGGQALARYILDNTSQFAAKRVLDIGAGSGIAAIAAAKVGAGQVTAADIDALAVAAMGLNATANDVEIAATTDDWLSGAAPSGDIVLVGDLFYERPLAKRVMAFVRQQAEKGSLVLVGDPRRSYFPTDDFAPVAHYEVPVTRELEDAEIKRAAVWQLRK